MMTAGWEWGQSPGTNYWQIQWRPYIKTLLYYQHDFRIERWYTNQVIMTIPEFTLDFYYSFLFAQTGQACIGFGWNMGEVAAQVKTKI